MVVPERQVVNTTALRFFPPTNECEALGDVTINRWMDLDGLVMI
jgi:hypothetical protein